MTVAGTPTDNLKLADIQVAVQATNFDYLALHDSGLVANYRIASQDGRLEYYPVAGGSTKLIATLDDLTTKQDAAAFLTTLVGIGTLNGSAGSLVRGTGATLTSPTFSGTVTANGLLDLRDASAHFIAQFTSSLFLYTDTSQLSLYNSGTAAHFIAFNRNGTTFNLASSYMIGWNSTTNATGGVVQTTMSQQSAGIVQIGTGANANGSLACTNVIISGRLDGPATMIFRCAGVGGTSGVWQFQDVNGATRAQISCLNGQIQSDAGVGAINTSRTVISGTNALDIVRNDLIRSRAASFGAYEASIYSPSAGLWNFGDGGANSNGTVAAALANLGSLALTPVTFAGLPPASANTGKSKQVSDRDYAIVTSNGTNWLRAGTSTVLT